MTSFAASRPALCGTILFLLTLALALAWCGHISMNAVVSAFYHPMAARGDLLFPLRQWAVAGPLLVAGLMICLCLKGRRSDASAEASFRALRVRRRVALGLVLLLGSALLPALPRIDSGYRQVYWLGGDRYEIPWQYSPYNGSPEPGGTYFLIKVSGASLQPRYETLQPSVILGKATASRGRDKCRGEHSLSRCEWRRGGEVYSISGRLPAGPEGIEALQDRAAGLLDSFRVSVAPQ